MIKILVSLFLSISFVNYGFAQGLLFDDLPTFPDSDSETEAVAEDSTATTKNNPPQSSATTTTVTVADSNTGLPTLTGGIIVLTLSLLFLTGIKMKLRGLKPVVFSPPLWIQENRNTGNRKPVERNPAEAPPAAGRRRIVHTKKRSHV